MAKITIFLILINAIVTLAVKNGSLTFVIDHTGSMGTDIDKVKTGSRYIMDVIFDSGSSQIEDLVLVIFNDPDVIFYGSTKDRHEFGKKLDKIKVRGGGDCTEMSLTGLELGLNNSRPNSFVFLFTDDGPKDAIIDRIERIKRICQEKSSHVVFVVTPNEICVNPNISSYHDIAQSSTGQVLLLDKKFEVEKIMPYINNTVTGDRTLITSQVFPPSQWIDVPFEIDNQTQYAVASTSGKNVKFLLLDDNNEHTNDFEPLVWIENVKVVKINKPGRYTAQVRSNSTASIVIFARTDFTFEPGFSVTDVESFDDTEKQPYEGIPTYLWISINEPKHLIEINITEILDMNENFIQKLPLKKVYDDVYVTDLFLTPNTMFKVAVRGIVRKTGKSIRRFAKIPVEPRKPRLGPPQIITTDVVFNAVVGDEVLRIPCVAFGYPVPSIKWFNNGTLIEEGDKYSIENGTLIIKNILSKSNVSYTCVAENSQGRAEQNHTVYIENTVDNNNPERTYVLKGTNDTLKCSLNISNTDSVRWYKNGQLHSEGPLMYLIDAATEHDANYTCRVSNKFGSENGKTIEVIVDAPPTRRQNAKSHHLKKYDGGEGDIDCEVDTFKPDVEIQWFHNGILMKGKRSMNLKFLTWGNYTCKVSNFYGSVENSFLVTSKTVS